MLNKTKQSAGRRTARGIEELEFQATWRDYQKRVLSELEDHLDDDHLHIVAAPGSGKTILGLEVMRRLGEPALILAPTITVRNQWVQRLLSMFLPDGAADPDWISRDIRNPSLLTVTTYQALNAAMPGEEDEGHPPGLKEEDERPKRTGNTDPAGYLLKLLNEQGIRTLVLDEAHHLRREWWKSVTRTKAGLKKPITVALTATPPYDVDQTEWERYQELCGPADADISVPELVRQGDLCPHQDYVFFSLPTAIEAEKLSQIKVNISEFVELLTRNRPFLEALQEYPWIHSPNDNIEAVLGDPSFFSSMLIFLNHAGAPPPREAREVLGIGAAEFPQLGVGHLETLLTGVFFTHAEDFSRHEQPLAELQRHLRRIGAIDRRKVILDDVKEVQKVLASSMSKLDGIIEVAAMEWSVLADDLRMVVLADFIRKSEMPSGKGDERPLNKIGVVPIFEHLRRSGLKGPKLGILTGSLIVVPADCMPMVQAVASEMGLDGSHVRSNPIPYDDSYVRLEITGESRQRVVHLVTEVFGRGGINILVGTQALLGEGWDAPSVNSLILASHVGSYMLSNQMRGRAIRTDPQKPGKTANIWHLVAIDIETIQERVRSILSGKTDRQRHFDPFDEIKEDLGHDLRMLRRRFRAFEGLSFTDPVVIENGFKRLALSDVKWTDAGVEALSHTMLSRASQRWRLADIWRTALDGKNSKPKMRERVESNSVPRGLAFADTIKFLAVQALITGVVYGLWAMDSVRMPQSYTVAVTTGFVVGTIMTAPKLLKALYLLIRNGSLENSIKQVGWAVLETLQFMEIIRTANRSLRIETAKDRVGVAYCRLAGATPIERQYFLDAMQQVLGPVHNPRYLLVRRSTLGRLLRVDYHPVPDLIGQNKKFATHFAKRWKRYVGQSSLVYVRSIEGRRILLQARTRALSSAFRKKTDRVSIWE